MTKTRKQTQWEKAQILQRHLRNKFGDRVICQTCGATFGSFDLTCSAPLDATCDGFAVIELSTMGDARNLTSIPTEQLQRCQRIVDEALQS